MQTCRIADVLFTPATGELKRNGSELRLEPKAAEVLSRLCADPGALVDRRILLDRCWGEGEGSDEALTQAVAQIRRGMEELGQTGSLIQTYPKRGYRLVAETDALTAEPVPRAPANPNRRNRLFAAVLAVVFALIIWNGSSHKLTHLIRHGLGLGPSTGAWSDHALEDAGARTESEPSLSKLDQTSLSEPLD